MSCLLDSGFGENKNVKVYKRQTDGRQDDLQNTDILHVHVTTRGTKYNTKTISSLFTVFIIFNLIKLIKISCSIYATAMNIASFIMISLIIKELDGNEISKLESLWCFLNK